MWDNNVYRGFFIDPFCKLEWDFLQCFVNYQFWVLDFTSLNSQQLCMRAWCCTVRLLMMLYAMHAPLVASPDSFMLCQSIEVSIEHAQAHHVLLQQQAKFKAEGNTVVRSKFISIPCQKYILLYKSWWQWFICVYIFCFVWNILQFTSETDTLHLYSRYTEFVFCAPVP